MVTLPPAPSLELDLPPTSLNVRRHAIAQAVVIPLFHLLVFVGICRAMGWSFEQYTGAADGVSYIWKAARFGGETLVNVNNDERVFPGYSLLMASVSAVTGLSLAWSGLLIAWISSAALSVTGTLWLRRPAFGWLLFVVPGGFLIRKSMVANEPLYLFLAVLGCAIGLRRNQWLATGVLLACAGLVRGPNAVFPGLGIAVMLMSVRAWRPLVRYVIGGTVTGIALLLLVHLLGEPLLDSGRGYQRGWGGGPIFTWPGGALFEVARPASFRNPNYLFVLGFYAMTLLTVAVLAHAAWRHRGQYLLHFVWAGGNTIFCLCLASFIGVVSAPRYLSWAIPSMLIAVLIGLNPSRKRVWITTAVLLILTLVADLALSIAAREVR